MLRNTQRGNKNNTIFMGFQQQQLQQQPRNNYKTRVSDDALVVVEIPKKEMLWGPPTWLLFHTLAEKVNEELFGQVRLELLNIVYTIVSLLKCSICAEHGKTFLNGINFNTIVTKEQFKYMLFDFHNLVNHKKKLPLFLYNDLVKYERAITIKVIQNFMNNFSQNSGSIRLISDDLHRKSTIKLITKWFNDNIKYFST